MNGVTGNTKILLSTLLSKPANQIAVGDQLLSISYDGLQQTTITVKDILVGKPQKVMSILLVNGRTLKLAPNKFVLTKQGNSFVFVNASKLTTNHQVVIKYLLGDGMPSVIPTVAEYYKYLTNMISNKRVLSHNDFVTNYHISDDKFAFPILQIKDTSFENVYSIIPDLPNSSIITNGIVTM